MKQTVTVELIKLEDLKPSDLRKLPKKMQESLQAMPAAEHNIKSILFVDDFPPRIIDSRSVHRYFPMLMPRTFTEAVALLRDCDNLFMSRGSLRVQWHKELKSFIGQDGEMWCPGPDDVLSNQQEWYVNSNAQPDPKKAEMLKEYSSYRHLAPEARMVTDGEHSHLKVTGLEELNG